MLKEAMGEWVGEQVGKELVQFEQRVPRWDRMKNNKVERAILDITLVHGGKTCYIDVSVTDALAAGRSSLRVRATTAGVPARDREKEKHTRYPGNDLIPAAVESGGRMGDEGLAFLAQVMPKPFTKPDETLRACALRAEDLGGLIPT